MIIVYMGDSITEGQYVDPKLRWAELVSTSLLNRFGDLQFFTRGISGETTRQGLERFPKDVQNLNPDVMTLQFGLNDCNCWNTDNGLPRVSEPAYRANLVEMIERGRHFGAKRIILSTNHPTLRHTKMASGETLEERRIRYNVIVREVASVTGVTLCDMEAAFRGLNLATMLLPAPDVLHLSQEGHAFYASVIIKPLSQAIEGLQ